MNPLFIARLKLLANDYGYETSLRGLAKLWAEVDPENALVVSAPAPKAAASAGASAGAAPASPSLAQAAIIELAKRFGPIYGSGSMTLPSSRYNWGSFDPMPLPKVPYTAPLPVGSAPLAIEGAPGSNWYRDNILGKARGEK